MVEPGPRTTRLVINRLLLIFPLLPFTLLSMHRGASPTRAMPDADSPPGIQGPFVGPTLQAYELNSDLRDLAGSRKPDEIFAPMPVPLKYVPGTEPKGASETIASWIDPVAQTAPGAGRCLPQPGLHRP